MPPEIKVLSDEEVNAVEALVMAAIRWTEAKDAKVVPDFKLLMADYRRLRKQG